MKLKAVLSEDEFGELEETTKGLYTQNDDGKYVLDVDGVDDLPQIQGLKNGHKNSKRERDEAKRQAEALRRRLGPLADLEDLDLSDAEQERLERLLPYLKGEAEIPEEAPDDKNKGRKPGDQIDLDKIKANARKPVERDLESVTAERDTLRTQLESLVVESAISNALTAIKVTDPDYREALMFKYQKITKVTTDDDGRPIAVIEGEYGEQPVEKYFKEVAQTDAIKKFQDAAGNTGGGARGGTGNGKLKNPWSKDNWSPKEQGRIYREQGRDVASRMAAEHGHKVL